MGGIGEKMLFGSSSLLFVCLYWLEHDNPSAYVREHKHEVREWMEVCLTIIGWMSVDIIWKCSESWAL